MKINKKNPRHLYALAISFVNSLIVVGIRNVFSNNRTKSSAKYIIFYGHTLNGNLKAFFDFLNTKEGYKPFFLVLDTKYLHKLKESNKYKNQILNALSMRDMLFVAKADAFITSHGVHLFSPIRRFTDIKFIDVWHAISYKGYHERGLDELYKHDAIWLSSNKYRELYINRYGFDRKKTIVTGYARADQLVNKSLDKKSILKKYNIKKAKKYILIAPTWTQDVKNRPILPFGLTPEKFFGDLDDLAQKHNSLTIFRTHLNSGNSINMSGLKNTVFMPYSEYEILEDFLWIADILVTDWSSTGIDYLPLRRPTIFLDVDAPFRYGFNLGPEHRFGDVVSNLNSLIRRLEEYLVDPSLFTKRHRKQMDVTTKFAYGDSLDGKSTQRYFENLERILKK